MSLVKALNKKARSFGTGFFIFLTWYFFETIGSRYLLEVFVYYGFYAVADFVQAGLSCGFVANDDNRLCV